MSMQHTSRSASDWLTVKCQPLGKNQAWWASDIELQLGQFKHWLVEFDATGKKGPLLWRQFSFADFEGVKLALKLLIQLADAQDHHPEVTFTFNQLTVRWNTHSADGITDNDWACAAKLDETLKHTGQIFK